MFRLLPFVLLVALATCEAPDASAPDASAPEASIPDPSEDTVGLARPSDEAIAARVADAEARLQATEGGQIVLDAINAHGGLATWYGNGPLHFRYTYRRLQGGDPIDTKQVVDPWQSRARHATMPDSAAQFGWTGTEAWVMPGDAELPTNARFWSLTPYYFVSMPFVLADEGVNLEPAGQMAAEGQTYDLVYVTFDDGTGDAPDDYYYLLVDPETRRVGGVRYIVSYPGFYEGGEHAQEKLMLYDGAQTASGITLQEGFRSWMWAEGAPAEASAEGTVTDVYFMPDAPDTLFALPAAATIQNNL